MYNDHKTARDRVKHQNRFTWIDGNLSKVQTIALIVIAVLYVLASNADYQIMMAGV